MRYVSGFFTFLVALLLLCSSVFASEFGMDDMPIDSPTESTESVPSYVSLDPNTIQDLVDALNDAWDSRDALSDADVTNPVIDISPDSVDAISGAISAGVSAALADADADDVPLSLSVDGISGGYYFVCDCALGASVKFWIPADFATGSIAFDGNNLINMTNSSIYILPDSPRLSSYTIYAPRFGHFQYRRTGYDYADLYITNIEDTNISFLNDTPQTVPDSTFWVILISVLMIGFLLMIFVKR